MNELNVVNEKKYLHLLCTSGSDITGFDTTDDDKMLTDRRQSHTVERTIGSETANLFKSEYVENLGFGILAGGSKDGAVVGTDQTGNVHIMNLHGANLLAGSSIDNNKISIITTTHHKHVRKPTQQ